MPQVRPPIEQVLTSDDAFTEQTTKYGDWVSGYIATAFWTSKTIAHPTSGSYSSTIAASELTDAFSDAGNWAKGGTPMSDRSGFMWRDEWSSADQKIELGFHVRLINGNGHNPDRLLDCVFVAARVSGGTYSSGSHTYTDVSDGYFFGLLSAATQESSWYLIRSNAGTLTVLQSRVFTGTVNKLSNEINALRSTRISMEVSASGANVRLVCKYRTPSSTGAIAETTVFDYTDTSGSKITAAGRCGFMLNGRRNVTGVPGGQTAPQATLFAIESAGVVVHRDTFDRIWRSAGKATSTTIGSETFDGNSLMSAWVGDWSTLIAYDKKLQRCAITGLSNRMMVDPNAEPLGSSTVPGAGAFVISQRPCTDAVSQHRSVRIRFSSLQDSGAAGTTNPTPHRAAGICVRIAGSGAPSLTWMPDAGYALIAHRDDAAGTSKLKLVRYDDGAEVLLASIDPYTFAVDTDYDLELDAYNILDGAGNPTSSVVLSAFIGGVQVTLEQDDAAVTIDANGSAIDSSSRRTISGRAEGIYCYAPSGDKVIVLDAWQELTLTNSSAATEVDQASVMIASEGDDATSDVFDFPIDSQLEVRSERTIDVMQMESGHKNLSIRRSGGRRVWRISSTLNNTQRDALKQFFDDHEGPRFGFLFTPPGETSQVTVHFVDAQLPHQTRGLGVNVFSFELEELKP